MPGSKAHGNYEAEDGLLSMAASIGFAIILAFAALTIHGCVATETHEQALQGGGGGE